MNRLEELEAALIKADARGNTNDAKAFAGEIRRMKSSPQSVQPKQMSTKETLSGQMKNTPSSAMGLVNDLTYPVRHPVDFNNAVTNLGKGVYQKFTDGVQPQEKNVDAMANYAKERFGGWDNIKRTAYKDPVGIAADAAGLLALRPIARLAAQPKKAAKTLSSAMDRKIYKDSYPSDSYKNVVKTSFEQKNLEKNINTALDERLEPTAASLGKREALIDEIDSSIDGLISESTANGNKVPVEKVFSEIDALKAKLGTGMNADGLGNIVKIDDAVEKIADAAIKEGRTHFNVSELQTLKRNLYKESEFDVKQSKADKATNQARKNIASNAKTRIEGFVPEVKGLNQRYGNLIDVDKSLTRAARRVDGLNNVGIGAPIHVMGGAALGAPLMGVSPPMASAVSGLGAGAALFNAYRQAPKRKAKRAIRVHHAKKGNLKKDVSNLGLLQEMDRLNIPKELFLQGLLQTSREQQSK